MQSIEPIEDAISRLKRGKSVIVENFALFPAEMLSNKLLENSKLILSKTRANFLNIADYAITIKCDDLSIEEINNLVFGDKIDTPNFNKASDLEQSALDLLSHAELVPAAIIRESDKDSELSVSEINNYQDHYINNLEIITSAPLEMEAGSGHICAIKAPNSSKEHYAITIGDITSKTPLTRLHSSCYTGDILASLECDCRDQLYDSLKQMASHGSGILLYLMQEGRGIGLINKLRAYYKKDQGLDTVDANLFYGFGDDERSFSVAAKMLKLLDCKKVSLMTNNPRKIKGLEDAGIQIDNRIEMKADLHEHNEAYIKTKFSRMGHINSETD